MKYHEIEQKIIEIILKKFPNSKLSKDTKLFLDLNLDSLDYAEIVIEAEFLFQTDVLEKQISWQNIKTIEQLTLLFLENLKNES
jgi:acyl carrier protein